MTANNPIDKEAIRARYAEEREKRLRPDGNDQYLRIASLSMGLLAITVAPFRRRGAK